MNTVLTDNEAKSAISANVKRLLGERGMSQAELARATEESTARLSQMIHGQKLPSAAFLARIAEALAVAADDLLAIPGKKSPRRRNAG
jgi:transcriptional regulator with XRE-family HTH domain